MVAALGLGAQGDLSPGDSLCGRGGSRTVAIGVDRNAVLSEHGDTLGLGGRAAGCGALVITSALSVSGRCILVIDYPAVVLGLFIAAFGAGAGVGLAVVVLLPFGEIVRFGLGVVMCYAFHAVQAGTHRLPGLPLVAVLVGDQHGAGGGFGAGFCDAGDRNGGFALSLGSHLAGIINLRDFGLVARPSQGARCVGGLPHSGELTGAVDVQIYLRRDNGKVDKINRGSLGHGDVEAGSLRKRFDLGVAFLDSNQLQSGACRCGMSRFRLDLAVLLQLNVIIFRQMLKAGAVGLDNAPFQMIAAVLRQQSRKIGRKLCHVIFAQGNIRVCVNILKPQSIGRIIVYNNMPCAVVVVYTGVAGFQICAALRNAFDRDGMFGERCGIIAACVNFSMFDLDVACCRAFILEGDLIPIIGVDGVCADLQRNTLVLLDVDLFAADVAFQQHVLQRNLVK